MLTTSKSVNITEPIIEDSDGQNSKKKWLRLLVVPGIVILLVLLILPTVQFKHKEPSVEYRSIASGLTRRAAREVANTWNCTNKDCLVECSGGNTYTLSSSIASVLSNCKTLTQLVVKNCLFPLGEMQPNWLVGDFQIKTLKISNCNLQRIRPNAWSSSPFAKMTVLEMRQVSLQSLVMDSFKGLAELQTLHIENSHAQFQGSSFLSYLTNTLRKFKLEQINGELVNELWPWFSGGQFFFLEEVDLRYNNFADKLNAASFSAIRSLKSLILSNCRISSLASGTFAAMTTLAYLDLRHNLLTEIVEQNVVIPSGGVFRRILIFGNPWDCQCDDPLSISSVYNAYSKNFDENVTCFSPLERKGSRMLDLCKATTAVVTSSSSSNTVTSSTTSSTTITSTTTTQPSLVQLSCPNVDNANISLNLRFADPGLAFSIIPLSEFSVKLLITSWEGASLTVLWFYSNERQILGRDSTVAGKHNNAICRSKVTTELIIDGLLFETPYTFCVLQPNQLAISPFNCESHFSPHSSTLAKVCKLQDFMIGLLLICTFTSLVVGAIIMYFLVRWRPTLLRGKKRIVIVNRSSTDIFMTDINKRGRRFSVESYMSGKSYMNPNLYEVIEYQKRCDNYELSKDYIDRMPDASPPPPPLPKRLSRQMTARKDDVPNNVLY